MLNARMIASSFSLEKFCFTYLGEEGGKHLSKPHFSCAPSGIHKQIFRVLDDRTATKFVCAAPRDSGKSSIIALGFVLREVLLRPDLEYVLYIGPSEAAAARRMRDLQKEIFDNELITGDFGVLKTNEFNKHSTIIYKPDLDRPGRATNRQCLIRCTSPSVGVRGEKFGSSRVGLVICDDVQKDKALKNKALRQEFEDFLLAETLPAIEQGGRLVMIGNLTSEVAMMGSLLSGIPFSAPDGTTYGKENEESAAAHSTWKRLKFSALVPGENGEMVSYWPERWSMESLMLRKAEQGAARFAAEFLNSPITPETAMFQPGVLDKSRGYGDLPYSIDEAERRWPGIVTFGATDLAFSASERADQTVIATVGRLPDGTCLLLHVQAGPNPNLWQRRETIFQLYTRWRWSVFGIETTAAQRLFYDSMDEEQRRRGVTFQMEKIPHGGRIGKMERIRQLEPAFNMGHLLLATNDNATREVLLELRNDDAFNQHDDIPDCIEMAFGLARKHVGTATITLAYEDDREAEKEWNKQMGFEFGSEFGAMGGPF